MSGHFLQSERSSNGGFNFAILMRLQHHVGNTGANHAFAGAGSLPVWLAVHREIRSSQRIRAVFDYLATVLPAVI